MPQNNDDIVIDQEPPQGPQDTNAPSQVVQPSEGGIGDLQLDQCEDKDFITAAPFCPTCIIDESAVPDDWTDPEYDEEVFLDKSKCEYVAVVEVKLANILKKAQQGDLDSKFSELERKFIEEGIEEYQQNNPEILVTPEWFGNKPPPEALPIIEEARRKATEEIQFMKNEGYYVDTKMGKPNGSFNSLIDWARDPDRIRLGIRSILDETDKLNNNKTVCAFGGCQYNMEDVYENRDLINKYIMGLNSASKSLNNKLGDPAYSKMPTAAAIATAIASPVRMAAYAVATPFAWLGDQISNNAKNKDERKLAKRFDGMLTGFMGGGIKNSLERLNATYGTLNIYALEWNAYVPDDGVYLLPDTDVLRYTVRVPAFNVDILPPAEEDEDDAADKFTEAEISLDNADWRVKFTEMKTGLTLMRYEYDIFRIRDDGSILFDEEGATSFDMLEFEPIIASLKNFKRELEKLLNKNEMAFSYQKANPFTFVNYLFHKTVTNVRIEIAREEKNGTDGLIIKDIYVTIESCPEVKLTTKSIVSINNEKKDKTVGSIKKDDGEQSNTVSQTETATLYKKVTYLNKFKRRVSGSRADHSMLFLLSKMATALMGFQAEEKVKITDWAEDFIFPKVITNDGLAIGDNANDKTTLGCILENFPLMSAESWSSILDDLILGTWDVFRDELRKRMCKKDGKYIDPALERWANREVKKAKKEVYNAAKKNRVEAGKKEVDQAIRDAQQLDNLGRYYGETSKKGLEFVIDSPPSDVLDDPERLEEWREEQYESVTKQASKKARAAEKEFMKGMKDLGYEHPYTKDFKGAVKAQLPDYEESLTKKLVDIISGNNATKPEGETEGFFEFLSDIGLCGMILGLKKALGCLFGQFDLQKIAEYVLRQTLGALRIDQFIYFLTELLPVEQQLKVQEEVDKEIQSLFQGVVNVQSGDVLDASLYEKRGEGNPNPDFASLLGIGHDAGTKGSAKLSEFLQDRNNKKLDKLKSAYSDYPKDTKFKTVEQMAKDDKKIAKLNASIGKKQKRKAERDKLRTTKGYPKQGSIGKASAKIIGIIFKAYIDAIIDVNKLNTTSLLDLIKKLPVISSIPDFIFDFFTCPKKTIVEPPLKDIIKFNFKKPNFCDPTKPIIDFNFSKLKWPFVNPWKFLIDAFVAALIKVLTSILIKIVVQFLIELEKMLCKMLGALGKGALNYATGNFDEGAFSEAFRDAFCGENASDEDVKKAMAGAMKTTGIASASQARDVSQKVAAAFSGNFSKREMMLVIFKPEENAELMNRVTKVITTSAPELSEFFDPPTKAAKFFGALANVLPQDHKDEIRSSLDNLPLPDAPIFDTICLTDVELDAWNNLRQQNLENRGLSPEDAADQINKYNRRAEDTLVQLLESGPDNINSQIQELLSPVGGIDPFGDPDPRRPPSGCEDSKDKSKINSLIDEPQELTSLTGKGLDRVWRAINLKFAGDLYGDNNGLLSRILSDTRGNSFARHGFYRRFFLTRNIIWDSVEQQENSSKGLVAIFTSPFEPGGYFPTTVGLHLFKELQKDFEFKSLGMDEFGGKGKIKGTYNPFGLAPEISFNYNIEKYEKAEAFMDYQVPVIIDGFFTPPEDKTGQGSYSKWKQVVAYSSQVLLPEPKHNFNYRIRIDDKLNPFLITGDMRTGANNRYNMEVQQPMSEEVSSYLIDLEPAENERFRKSALEYTFNNIMKKYFSDASISITTDQYDEVISKCFNIFRDMCLDLTPRDGQPEAVEVRVIDEDGKATDQTENVTVPDGFLFGYSNIDFEEDERTYVGPDGEEYDYEEEEQVLGRMKKQNPRIHILDPKKYGGSYSRPPWYIEEPQFKGWLNIAKTIAPDISGCEPSKQSILQINKIMEHVKNARNKIKSNPKLFEGRGDCFYHIPFDRLVSKESLAMMEGCVKTVMRINIIEQLIGAIPIMGFVEYNERNFGSSFAQLVAKRIQQDLATTDVGLFPRKIEKQNYWLSFLEQAVQMFWRMWESGDLDYKNADGEQELPEHIEDIFDELRDLQEAYNWKDGMWRNPRSKQGVRSDAGFGDNDALPNRSNRRIHLPGYYYDFDNKKFKDINVTEEPVFEFSEPIPITYEEYLSAVANQEARYSLEEAQETGGAYIVSPPIEDFPAEYGWLNPPPDAVFARIDKVQTGTKQVTKQKVLYRIDGPYEATKQEFLAGVDLDPLPIGTEIGNQLSTLLARRVSVAAAAEYGGVVKTSPVEEKYEKYRTVVSGYTDFYLPQDPFNFQQQYAHYCALAYQSYGDAILYSNEELEFGESITFGPLDSSWQFASCMWAVRSVQDKCMIILTELINQEIKDVMDLFTKAWKPQVLDVNRYLLNTPLFVDNGLKNFGTRDHEERVVMGSFSEMGEVADVVINANIESSFADTESDMPIKFKLEKYIRVVEKKLEEGQQLPKPFEERDSTLRGVINIKHFQEFIDKNKEEYGEYFISDLFGDAEMLYSFKFNRVFGILNEHLNNDSEDDEFDRVNEKSEKIERESANVETFTPTSDPNNPIAGYFDRKSTFVSFFEGYGVILTEQQLEAFSYGALQQEEVDGRTREIDYGEVLLPKNLISESWFLESYNVDQNGQFKPVDIQGNIGLKYGVRIVANLPEGSGIPEASLDNLAKSKFALEKCFYMNVDNDLANYQKNFSLPIAVAEVDIIDHKIKDFNWTLEGGDAEYPMDLDCLLRKLIKTPEYEIIFKHVMNPSAVNSMCAILSGISFESSVGYNDGWERVVTFEDPDGEEQDGAISMDDDEWQRKYFQDTRMLVRRVFSGFYLANDFEDPEADTFDFAAILKVAVGSVFGWMKKGISGISAWWRTNLQDNPYDANGEECKTEYEKLLG